MVALIMTFLTLIKASKKAGIWKDNTTEGYIS